MTSSQHLFTSFVRCNASHSIKIINGSLLNFSSMGTVVLGPQLCLTNVLYVLGFSCNLLFISKLTANKKLIALFTSSTCQFQDQILGQMIRSAKDVHGLYYFFL